MPIIAVCTPARVFRKWCNGSVKRHQQVFFSFWSVQNKETKREFTVYPGLVNAWTPRVQLVLPVLPVGWVPQAGNAGSCYKWKPICTTSHRTAVLSVSLWQHQTHSHICSSIPHIWYGNPSPVKFLFTFNAVQDGVVESSTLVFGR
jgi:hypothetical protein